MKTNNTLENLNKFISTMEVSLGMNVSVNGSSLKELPLYDFLLVCQKAIKSADRNQLDKYGCNIMQFSRSLSYLNERLTFANQQVLDFQLYDNADVLCCFFLQFQEHRDIENFKKKELSSFIKYMEICEQRNVNLKKTLSYRTIRLFLTFVCMGFHIDASVVCQFIRNQFWISEGFNPRSKLSTSERAKILNSVKSERFKYSKRFKNKMKTAITNVAKHTEVSKDTNTAVDAEFNSYNEGVKPVVPDEQEKEINKESKIDSKSEPNENLKTELNENLKSELKTEPDIESNIKDDVEIIQQLEIKEDSEFEVKEDSKPSIKEEIKPNIKNTKPKVNYGSRRVIRTNTKASNNSKPRVNKNVETKPAVEQPVETKPVVEQPVVEQPIETKPVVEQPVVEQPIETKPNEMFGSKKGNVKFEDDKVIYNDVISSNVFESIDVNEFNVNTKSEPVKSEPVKSEPSGNVKVKKDFVLNKSNNRKTSRLNSNKESLKRSSIF